MSGYNPHNKAVLSKALKGKGACPNVKAGDRLQYLWKKSDEEGSDPLTNITALMDWSDNEIILDYICETQGGVFVKNEEGCKKSRNVQLDMSNMLKEVSDVWSVCAKSLDDDGKIDTNEAIEIRREAKEAMQSIESFLNNLEAGRY